jgi:hypothetical protein
MKIGKFGGTLVLCAGLSAGGLASVPAATADAPAVAHSEVAHLAAAGAASSRTVTLITGDRVAVATTGSGRPAGAVARVAGSAGSGAVIRLSLGGRAYVIPADALPYLGRGLSPALFEPDSLLRAESGGRLLVQIGYRGRLHALPGVTITGSRGGPARGYLTAASAGRSARRWPGSSPPTTPAPATAPTACSRAACRSACPARCRRLRPARTIPCTR